MVSVRCHLSFVITLAKTKPLQVNLGRFRLPQHVLDDLGESDDRRLVYVNDDHGKLV